MKEFLVWPVSCFGHEKQEGIMTLITTSHWGVICDDFTCTSAVYNIFKPGWIDFLLNHSQQLLLGEEQVQTGKVAKFCILRWLEYDTLCTLDDLCHDYD